MAGRKIRSGAWKEYRPGCSVYCRFGAGVHSSSRNDQYGIDHPDLDDLRRGNRFLRSDL